MHVGRRVLPLKLEEIPTKITVLGVGNCGNNAINNLASSGIEVAKLVAVNTDVNVLRNVMAHENVQIGESVLKGRGTGGDIAKGRSAAEEDLDKVLNAIGDPDLVIAAASLGGGTGSGALPVILSAIREENPEITIMSVVTLPFRYEGVERMKNAQAGLRETIIRSDTTIVNMNDMLLEKFGEIPVRESFKIMDDVLLKTIIGLVDMIDPRGAAIRTDFSDFVSVIKRSGVGFVGHGQHGNIKKAVSRAIESRLLDADPSSAHGALLYLTVHGTVSLSEASEAPRLINEKYGIERLSWGLKVKEMIRMPSVMVVATGVSSKTISELIGDVGALIKE